MSEVLTTETIKEIDHWLSKFPEGKQRSAIIGSLHAAQHQNHGFLTSELMDAVAAYIDVPKIQVYEVATFYTMYNLSPVGKYFVQVCTTTPCLLYTSPSPRD